MANSDRRADSPVFLLLPALASTDPAKLIVVQREFQDAVEKAENDDANGRPTLALLAEEAKRNAWAREGVRLVGRAQRRIKSFKAARESWEFIRNAIPDDIEANLQLATIFQRLGDLASASLTCRRVLDNAAADRKARADARSQLARNDKAAWVADFSTVPSEGRAQAISDNRLTEAFDGYKAGFAEDLNDYYSGIKALGLLTAIVKLAEMQPDDWAGLFESRKKVDTALDDYREELTHVRGAVRMSLENARRQVERGGKPDEWLAPSEAQYSLLTADNPVFVKNAYKAAKTAGKSGFSVESEAAQVRIFWHLGLFPDRCRAALEGLDIATNLPGPRPMSPSTSAPQRDRVIVGTGHRADASGRKAPRFPNTDDAIAKARNWLRQQLEAEQAKTTGAVRAFGGAAERHRPAVPRGLCRAQHREHGRASDSKGGLLSAVGHGWRPRLGGEIQSPARYHAGDHPERKRRTARLGCVVSAIRSFPAWQYLDDGEHFAAIQRGRHLGGVVEWTGRRRTGRHR
jgi:hypothetical protein